MTAKKTAGPDLSEFFRLSRPKKKPCSVGWARTQLSDDEQTQLDAAIATDQGIITNQAIVDWLAKREHVTTVSATVNHRKGVCSCGQED